MYVTGKFGVKRTSRWHRTLKAAEARIAKLAGTDPSVERGEWYIDGPCPVPRHLRRTRKA